MRGWNMANEEFECPDCDGKMFENRAGGLTCSNKKCGRVILHASAKNFHTALMVIKTQEKLIASSEKIMKIQEQMIKNLKGGKP